MSFATKTTILGIFDQYYDTALWIAGKLAKVLKDDVVAVYAGVGKSGLFQGAECPKPDPLSKH